MLNDEIDEVRIEALHGISVFNEILTLNVITNIYNKFRIMKLTSFCLI